VQKPAGPSGEAARLDFDGIVAGGRDGAGAGGSSPARRALATEPAPDRGSQLLAEISNAVVRIHKHAYGKGPVKARAHLSQDLLTVVLEGGFTRAEQTLHRHGHCQQVIDARLTIEHELEPKLRVLVERILYRAVRSFTSALDPANELQVQIFVLEPYGSEQRTGVDGAPGAWSAG
jgi:uncharacterized protein YbcI